MAEIIRFLVLGVLCFFCISGGLAHSSVTKVIRDNEKQEMRNIDATAFIFSYKLVRESYKIFKPMIAAPKQMMAALCGSPVNNARQLIYQYITSYHDVLVRDIVDFNKMLSFQHTETPKIGPLTEQVLKNLHAYYQIMEKGVLLNLSEDVMVARLADESFKMDLLLSQFGEKITGSVFDTFHEADMTKLALLSEDIKKGLREKCES